MSRLSSLVISGLVVGFIIGWLVNRLPARKGFGANHVVVVYGVPDENGTPEVQPDPLPITRDDEVSWVSTSPRKHVRIEFTDQVFENMKQLGNGRYVVQCKDRICDSDKVRIGPGKYKYWQILHNPGGSGEKSKDGWIIIERP